MLKLRSLSPRDAPRRLPLRALRFLAALIAIPVLGVTSPLPADSDAPAPPDARATAVYGYTTVGDTSYPHAGMLEIGERQDPQIYSYRFSGPIASLDPYSSRLLQFAHRSTSVDGVVTTATVQTSVWEYDDPPGALKREAQGEKVTILEGEEAPGWSFLSSGSAYFDTDAGTFHLVLRSFSRSGYALVSGNWDGQQELPEVVSEVLHVDLGWDSPVFRDIYFDAVSKQLILSNGTELHFIYPNLSETAPPPRHVADIASIPKNPAVTTAHWIPVIVDDHLRACYYSGANPPALILASPHPQDLAGYTILQYSQETRTGVLHNDETDELLPFDLRFPAFPAIGAALPTGEIYIGSSAIGVDGDDLVLILEQFGSGTAHLNHQYTLSTAAGGPPTLERDGIWPARGMYDGHFGAPPASIIGSRVLALPSGGGCQVWSGLAAGTLPSLDVEMYDYDNRNYAASEFDAARGLLYFVAGQEHAALLAYRSSTTGNALTLEKILPHQTDFCRVTGAELSPSGQHLYVSQSSYGPEDDSQVGVIALHPDDPNAAPEYVGRAAQSALSEVLDGGGYWYPNLTITHDGNTLLQWKAGATNDFATDSNVAVYDIEEEGGLPRLVQMIDVQADGGELSKVLSYGPEYPDVLLAQTKRPSGDVSESTTLPSKSRVIAMRRAPGSEQLETFASLPTAGVDTLRAEETFASIWDTRRKHWIAFVRPIGVETGTCTSHTWNLSDLENPFYAGVRYNLPIAPRSMTLAYSPQSSIIYGYGASSDELGFVKPFTLTDTGTLTQLGIVPVPAFILPRPSGIGNLTRAVYENHQAGQTYVVQWDKVITLSSSLEGVMHAQPIEVTEQGELHEMEFHVHAPLGRLRFAIYTLPDDGAAAPQRVWSSGIVENHITNGLLRVPVWGGDPSRVSLSPGRYLMTYQIDAWQRIASLISAESGTGFTVAYPFLEPPAELPREWLLPSTNQWTQSVTVGDAAAAIALGGLIIR